MLDYRKLSSTLLFIFGGSGDLNYRKLTPALYNLYLDGAMPENFRIIGISRTDFSDTDYKKHLKEGIDKFSRKKGDPEMWKKFVTHLEYVKMDISERSNFDKIETISRKYEKDFGERPEIVFYMAVAPQIVPMIVKHLSDLKICHRTGSTRICVEKPFGHDLESAREMNATLLSYFEEKQIYRIDHYLGKETVQNLLAFRFANSLFEPIWNQNYIDHIQISAAEIVGVENRGGYYENAGALRDMIQNHILQVLCMIAMEPPISFNAEEIRNKKADVLKAIRRIDKSQVSEFASRGQYKSGWLEGEQVPGYREEKDVDPESAVETFAAVKFFIDNWRWQGVPIYVRTGKRLHAKSTEITVQFQSAPDYAFPKESVGSWKHNRLSIGIAPEMNIGIRFQAKRPGQAMALSPVDMIFNYKDSFKDEEPEAYETLLYDLMAGDATLFMRADQVEQAWEVVMPIIEAWEARKPMSFPNYSPGSWGPESAQALISRDGHNWISQYS